MAKKEQLGTARAALIRALEVTEKLLDGFPIPGAKGTIGAVLEIITEAEVRTKMSPRSSSSLSPLQRTATNAELCNKLRAHIEGLHDQLLQPLVGKTEDDIPKDTRAAVEDYTEYIGFVSFGNRCLTNDYRRIRCGLQQLRRPQLAEYGRFRRWIHSKEIEGDIRMVMDLIRLDTEAHMVSFARDRKRNLC